MTDQPAVRPASLTVAERRAAVAATVLLAALMVMWSVVAPAYRASDEPMHVSTTLRLAESGRYPPPGRALMDPSVLASFRWVNYFGRAGRVPTVDRPAALSQPPSMHELSGPNVPRAKTDIDQMTQHPPGYYLLMAGAVKALRLDDASPNGLILGLRLVSSLLLLPIPFLCLLVARRVGLAPRVAAASAFFPAAWMQFVHASATVNNGALLALATSVAIALLVPVAQGDVGVRRALGVGAAVSVALLTKGFALALLPTIALAYLLAARRSGLRRAALAALVAGLATLPGLWWWVLNVVRYGSLQPKGTRDNAPVVDALPVTQWIHDFALTWMRTLWVAVGWAEGRPPPWLYIGLTLAVAALVLAGSWALRRNLGAVLVLHTFWAGPLAIVALGSLQEFMYSGQTRAAQGRYVQIAVVAFAVLVIASLTRFARFMAVVPALVLVSAVGGLGYGLYHFWRPADGQNVVWGRVVSMVSWWPGGLAWLIVAAVVATVSGVAGVLALRSVDLRSVPLQPSSRWSGEPAPAAPGSAG